MKKIAFFLILLILPIKVLATDINLLELNILNGEISPSFDPLNNTYSVLIDKDVSNLDIAFKNNDGVIVDIIDNFDLENNSMVKIKCHSNNKEVIYNLLIVKEEEENLFVFKEDKNELDTSFMSLYKIYVIPSVCFLIILIFFKLIFPKHKK